MNKADISKEKILEVSIALLKQGGANQLNMREIAKSCQVAVGSIYNYFPTKGELTIAIMEKMWGKIFHSVMDRMELDAGFVRLTAVMYERLKASREEYGNLFIIHRTLLEPDSRIQGKSVMMQYFGHITDKLLESLRSDKLVKKKIWTEEFTPEAMVEFVWDNMLILMSKEEANSDFLIQILNHVLYERGGLEYAGNYGNTI